MVIRFLQTCISGLGRGVAWLSLLMVIAMFVSVVLSYFKVNAIAFQESISWMHGLVFLLGAAYTLQRDEHVRVDIFYQHMTIRQRAWINLVGTVILLLPVMFFILWMSLSFVVNSWQICETSSEAGGLPGRFLFRTLIIAMPVFMMMQALADSLVNINSLLDPESKNKLTDRKKLQIDSIALLSLLVLLVGFILFAGFWIAGHCQKQGFSTQAALTQLGLYSLLLAPVIFIPGQVLVDLIRVLKRLRSAEYKDDLFAESSDKSEV